MLIRRNRLGVWALAALAGVAPAARAAALLAPGAPSKPRVASSIGSGHDSALDRLTTVAWAHQARVAAARAKWAAARARIPLVQQWADPMAEAGLGNFLTLGGPQLTVSQSIPWPGRLAIVGQEARASAAVARYDYLAVRDDIREELRRDLAERYYLAAATAIDRRAQQRDRDIARIVATLYAVGKAPQADLLQIQLRQADLLEDLTTLGQERESNTAKLAWLLGNHGMAGLPAARVAPPQPRIDASSEQLLRLGLASAPPVLAAGAAQRAASAQLALVRFDSLHPRSIAAGVSVGNNMATKMDFLGASVGIPLPFIKPERHREATAAARQALEAASQAVSQVRLDLEVQIRDLLAKLHSDDKLLALQHKALEPEAVLALDTARSAYEVGKTDLTTVLDRDAELDTVVLRSARLGADREDALAGLEQALGRPLPESKP